MSFVGYCTVWGADHQCCYWESLGMSIEWVSVQFLDIGVVIAGVLGTVALVDVSRGSRGLGAVTLS